MQKPDREEGRNIRECRSPTVRNGVTYVQKLPVAERLASGASRLSSV